MDIDEIVVVILVPIFVIGLQKYIEARASYRRPTEADVRRVEGSLGLKAAGLIKAIPGIRVTIILGAIIFLYIFRFSEGKLLKWFSLGGVAICVAAMSILVNWRLASDR